MELTLEKTLKLLKRYFFLMLAVAALFYMLGYFYTKRSTSVRYFSYTEVYINTTTSDPEKFYTQISLEKGLVGTYTAFINTFKFYNELYEEMVSEQEKERAKPIEQQDTKFASMTVPHAWLLKANTSISQRDETAILRFTVIQSTPEAAYYTALHISQYVDDYLFEQFGTNSVRIVESARPASASYSQSRDMSLIAAIIGAVVVFVLVYIKDMFDVRIRNVDDLEQFSLPVLGTVPAYKSGVSLKKSARKRSGYSGYYGYGDRKPQTKNDKDANTEKK